MTATTDLSFSVRIPGWANQMTSQYSLAGGKSRVLSPDSNDLQTFQINKGTTKLIVELGMDVQVIESTVNGTAAVYYGPLLYALDIDYNSSYHSPLNYSSLEPLPADQVLPQTHDYVLDPSANWQYAIDPTSVAIEQVYNRDGQLPSGLRTPLPLPYLWTRGWSPGRRTWEPPRCPLNIPTSVALLVRSACSPTGRRSCTLPIFPLQYSPRGC